MPKDIPCILQKKSAVQRKGSHLNNVKHNMAMCLKYYVNGVYGTCYAASATFKHTNYIFIYIYLHVNNPVSGSIPGTRTVSLLDTVQIKPL